MFDRLRRRFALPPHVAWPALIVVLLLMSVGVSIAAVIAANSDGGAKPVDEYYAKAADYDRLAVAQRTSDALGWTLGAASAPGPLAGLREAVLVVRDRAGKPVDGLAGTLSVNRADENENKDETVPLAHVPVAAAGAGRYTTSFPFDGAGVYVFALDAARGQERFLTTARVAVR